jgi:hypothetical protein
MTSSKSVDASDGEEGETVKIGLELYERGPSRRAAGRPAGRQDSTFSNIYISTSTGPTETVKIGLVLYERGPSCRAAGHPAGRQAVPPGGRTALFQTSISQQVLVLQNFSK